MKKIKVNGKLNLNKSVVSNLSNHQMHDVKGGAAGGGEEAAAGILSIGKRCTQPCFCDIDEWSASLFCRK